MTALCAGGGASSAQPNAPAQVAFTSSTLDLLLEGAGLWWLIPFVTAYESKFFNLSTFCTVDPPAVPVFNVTDLTALFNPFFNTSDSSAAQAKLDALIQNMAWYQFCQCNAGPQPIQPLPLTAQPANLPSVVGAATALCVPMLASQCRVLNLWNGVGNDAPPANWDQVTFDDHTWAIGTEALSFFGPSHIPSFIASVGVAPQCLPNTACVPHRVAPWLQPATGQEEFLVRWRFDLPSSFDANALCVSFFHEFDGGLGGWGSGLENVNGGGQSVFHNNANWTGHMTDFKAGANLMALWVNSGNIGAAATWGTHGAIGMTLTQSGALGANGNQGCCPPDPAILNMLNQLNAGLTLLQRQLLPFAYIQSTAHAGLMDSGTIPVADLLGVLVQITTNPGYTGLEAANPDRLFDVGWVSLMTPDGLIDQRRIQATNTVWQPRLMSDATVVGYFLNPGVVATITELVREP